MTTATWCLGLGLSLGGVVTWAYLAHQEWRRRYDARTAARSSSRLLANRVKVRYTEGSTQDDAKEARP